MGKTYLNKIYKITSPSGKSYIGRTNHPTARFAKHRYNANEGKKGSLYAAIRKYGWDSMTVEIIDKIESVDGAKLLEAYYISKYDSVKRGYNDTYLTEGGDNWSGLRNTPQFQEFLDKMSSINSGKKNPMYGKKHTAKAIKKQKKKAKGRYSLPWFIGRHGIDEGKRLYEERCAWLKSRNLPKGPDGKFISNK